MKNDPISKLLDYLQDPLFPTWSSQGLIDLFNILDGDMKEKQQFILPIIDEKLSSGNNEMTENQFHFLRDITLHTFYPKTSVKFSLEDLNWLINRFYKNPTQQRATLISMLLDIGELPEKSKQIIKKLLQGTLAEPYT